MKFDTPNKLLQSTQTGRATELTVESRIENATATWFYAEGIPEIAYIWKPYNNSWIREVDERARQVGLHKQA